MKNTPFIWHNGKLIDNASATVHVLTHGLHYGTGVFEGVRAYATDQGPAIFQAKAHYDRLIHSALIYEMKPPYSSQTLIDATCDLIKANQLKSCYIRPLFFYGDKELGIFPKRNPVETIIAAWEWGAYLGAEGLQKGIRCMVSSWSRIDPRTLPSLAKCSGHYANAVLARQEAVSHGFDEAILLNTKGTIAEGPGENIFLIKNETIYTPPISDGILPGITRDSIMTVAQDKGYRVVEQSITRDMLYVADELFFTGTAAEVTPIREVDGRQIGDGCRGPITTDLQETFFDIVNGKNKKYSHWLTNV